MNSLRKTIMALALMLALPLSAQDFGYPKSKAFFKAHGEDLTKDLGDNTALFGAQYVLYDFDGDGSAELYVRNFMQEAFVYAIKGNKAVRIAENSLEKRDEYVRDFHPCFMAPIEMLFDKPVPSGITTEQHIYDMDDLPFVWYRLRPKVSGTFNIKSAMQSLNTFDCVMLNDAIDALCTGNYDKSQVDADGGYIMDPSNGYARISYTAEPRGTIEFCYWNMKGGEKLFAMHYLYFTKDLDDNPFETEQTLFMKYDPKTKSMMPIVAPIEGFDFKFDCNFELPRTGKNIRLVGPTVRELKWTGSGFKY